jgi:hypothetical protein
MIRNYLDDVIVGVLISSLVSLFDSRMGRCTRNTLNCRNVASSNGIGCGRHVRAGFEVDDGQDAELGKVESLVDVYHNGHHRATILPSNDLSGIGPKWRESIPTPGQSASTQTQPVGT